KRKPGLETKIKVCFSFGHISSFYRTHLSVFLPSRVKINLVKAGSFTNSINNYAKKQRPKKERTGLRFITFACQETFNIEFSFSSRQCMNVLYLISSIWPLKA